MYNNGFLKVGSLFLPSVNENGSEMSELFSGVLKPSIFKRESHLFKKTNITSPVNPNWEKVVFTLILYKINLMG